MKSTYKRLGDLIEPISIKNKDLLITDLRGVNYQKYFMPSVANTVGVDLSTYKIIEYNQFACNLMHVGRDGCLPIALHLETEPIIVSPAYFSFCVKDDSEILPEFLFMRFKRKEFDRQACFYTDADVRQGLIKEAFYNLMIPVPPIEEQRRIVAEYQAIERRIENNRRLIATLEATAQTIYRKMFVDGIDPENLPEGWRIGKLKDIADFAYGKMQKSKGRGHIPIFSGYGIVGYCDEEMFAEQHIVVIARGDSGSGRVVISPKKFFLTNLAIAILLTEECYREYLFQYLITQDTSSLRTGSAQAQVTINSLAKIPVIVPPLSICKRYYDEIDVFRMHIGSVLKENSLCESLKTILLTKISK